MGFEKEGAKGGRGYVGGFFQLFDWTAKSRKKLFSSNSEFPEHSKLGKKSDGNLSMMYATRLHPVGEDESGGRLCVKGSSDQSSASSVTDEEGCVTRAPGVVARLMGLHAMPTSSFSEPYSSPYFDTQSLPDAQYPMKNLDYQQNHQIYSGNFLNKVDDTSRNTLETKLQKMQNRPIKKFQTEVLPPKSAKSIPVTHHKLLSPIKSPAFIPSKNAAYIMEAAARIIEPGPQSTIKTRPSTLASSAVSLEVRELKDKVEAVQKGSGSSLITSRVRDLKEKAEASQRTQKLPEAQRTSESNAAKYLKGQFFNKSWNGTGDTPFRAHTDAEENCSLQNKGKSISLAIQAKVNVQRREGMDLNDSRSSGGKREQLVVKPSQTLKNQSNTQKNLNKKSGHNVSGVLKQNNQKQNALVDNVKLPSKSLVFKPQGRKVLPRDSAHRHQRSAFKCTGNSKVGSRKLGSDMTDSDKEIQYTRTNNFSRKKRSISRNCEFGKDQIIDNLFDDKFQKPIPSKPVTESCFNRVEDSKKKGNDIISFTFTAPLTRSNPSSDTSWKSNDLPKDHRFKRVLLDSDGTNSSSLGFNGLGGDALSILLEQKLRELTYGIASSHPNFAETQPSSNSTSNSQDPVASSITVGHKPSLQQNHQMPIADGFCGRQHNNLSYIAPLQLRLKHKPQAVDLMDKSRCSNIEAQFLNCLHPSPISILEPLLSAESCDSSISPDGNSTEGSKFCSSDQAQEGLSSSSSMKFYSAEADTELLDSASSISVETMGKMHTSTSLTRFERSSSWELDYVKEILCNVELMYKDFSSGRSVQVINPHLFNLLESRKGVLEIESGEPRQQRKVIFDCVSEYLDLRCRHFVGGGYRMWAKGLSMVKRKEWLAEEVYKEITGWSSMGDSMVDELVDNDMSSQYGKWTEFDVDAFALSMEVGGQVLNSLVDEVVADLFCM